ncbi:MAG: Gfo/Idh/MocA family oxidoreductase [Kiritimatiellaeota bacterium]|nr:Gfo/Idh/MocA family oxidoreductase [Kiritimatiellota bacterium]
MNRIRTAVVGIGGRGSYMARAVAARQDVELVALCDRLVRKAQHVAGEIGGDVPVFEHFEDLLAAVDCDAVMVTTSDAHHAEIVVPALASGKFVFCEKPLETTCEKCRRIVEADRKAGGRTFVGFNLRYAPTYVKVRDLIDHGQIGDVLTVQADEFYNGGRTYFRRWNRLRSEGGGLWITKASHDFDLLAWFAGTPAREVYATAAKTYYAPRSDAARRCRDCPLEASCPDRAPREPTVLQRLTEEAGGSPYDLCLFNADSDTFDHGIATVAFDAAVFATYTCNVVAGFSDRRIRVSGTKGAIDGKLSGGSIVLRRRDPSAVQEIPLGADTSSGHGGADTNVLDGFFGFVRGENEPKCRPAEAMTAVVLGLAATRAGDEHRVVPIEEIAPSAS